MGKSLANFRKKRKSQSTLSALKCVCTRQRSQLTTACGEALHGTTYQRSELPYGIFQNSHGRSLFFFGILYLLMRFPQEKNQDNKCYFYQSLGTWLKESGQYLVTVTSAFLTLARQHDKHSMAIALGYGMRQTIRSSSHLIFKAL